MAGDLDASCAEQHGSIYAGLQSTAGASQGTIQKMTIGFEIWRRSLIEVASSVRYQEGRGGYSTAAQRAIYDQTAMLG